MLRENLQGTGVALITPFAADLEIDFNALENRTINKPALINTAIMMISLRLILLSPLF